MQSELVIEAAVKNLPKVMGFIEQNLENTRCSMKARMQISIAAEEVFVNIANYAYAPGKGNATVRIDVSEEPVVIITFIDNGIPFNPLTRKDPDVGLPASRRRIGGLGIFMTKRAMDNVEYEYKDGQNILKLKKNL